MTLADQISKNRGQPSTVRIGTVVTVNPLTVLVQDTVITNIGALNGTKMVVGDTVAVLGQSAVSADGSSWLALGNILPAASVGDLYENGVNALTTSLSNATGVFATLTNITFQWRKLRTNSRVRIDMAGSAYMSAGNSGAEFGAQFVDNAAVLPSVDFVVASHFFNVTFTHLGWTGFLYLPAGTIPAGDYTINGRFRMYVVVGTLQLDGNDRISLTCREVD